MRYEEIDLGQISLRGSSTSDAVLWSHRKVNKELFDIGSACGSQISIFSSFYNLRNCESKFKKIFQCCFEWHAMRSTFLCFPLTTDQPAALEANFSAQWNFSFSHNDISDVSLSRLFTRWVFVNELKVLFDLTDRVTDRMGRGAPKKSSKKGGRKREDTHHICAAFWAVKKAQYLTAVRMCQFASMFQKCLFVLVANRFNWSIRLWFFLTDIQIAKVSKYLACLAIWLQSCYLNISFLFYSMHVYLCGWKACCAAPCKHHNTLYNL